MQLFVYEYLSAGVDRSLPASLRAEGWAMLEAVCLDLAQLSGVEVRTLLSADEDRLLRGSRSERVQPADEETAFRHLARWADYSLIIAPEFDGILQTRCRWVEEEGGGLLGPSSRAVAQAADKFTLAEQLRLRGVRTPSCAPISSAGDLGFPLVCKPRHGAGSLATFLVWDKPALLASVEQARSEGWTQELLVQPFIPGLAASIAFLIGSHIAVPLPPATQRLSDDGRFRYHGGAVPLPVDPADRVVRIAQPAVAIVPGLRGYVGVDVVLGDAPDGSCDWVIEINPRMTTSYIGLRALAQTNLAEAMLQIVHFDEVPSISWRSGTLLFRPESLSAFGSSIGCPHIFSNESQNP
jgi:predicted ATP-grasp superfamily ATP-dependent carboligase